ncbi:formate dehydrogenase accessory sulfurtransferase FdhD [Methylorubrum extorquens]|uniref:formate dehydrogenase accessory sulfurtransferase FdhD n=1 Tax=Methylorubrum extorquens TaxID=408 RepID=UPI000158FFC2|nr:formate dehydrogenase accessory sulfurtransferase FdhD [Methylorubrum extorquens]ABY31651.1 formate dehydrogenase family accessory protein FdhD [Methylorubrum extorquens PA1]KQP86932.1 formate dehydrogenase family accessory protein FdhD [Methylobacterium sp. Leaf119]WIU38276.1 formate dehydrogenase accessory sulfurtransferase FdhD [Methylorubrum extorquens]
MQDVVAKPEQEAGDDFGAVGPATSVKVGTLVVAYDAPEARPDSRALAVEMPVNVVYGTVPYAVMMLTPADLEDFAYGFSLTEGVIEAPDEIRGASVEPGEGGLRLLVDLAPGRLREHLARKRAISGRTGCGVCGIEDLAALPIARPRSGKGPQVTLAAIQTALTALSDRQTLNRETRAVHAAGWANLDGSLLAVREDVGRHNALDKCIGALLRQGVRPDEGFLVITSRCSFEMAEKAASLGASVLVAISAPTSLAIERARCHDMTLCAIARSDTLTVFSGRERLILAGEEG